MVREQTRKYRRVQRTDVNRVIELNALGTRQYRIASTLRLNRKTVQRVLTHKNDYDVCVPRPRSGRPQKYDDRAKRLIGQIIENGEATTATGAHKIATRDHHIDISLRSVRNILHELGIHVRHATRRPKLSRNHRKERMKFAKEHLKWDVEQWKQVLFTDETIITSLPMDSRHLVWTKNVDPLDPKLIIESIQGGGAKIMVWGSISFNGVHDLALIEGSLNSEGYIDILKEYMLPVRTEYFRGKTFVFQQDGATVHTSHLTMNFLKDENIKVLEWPAHSPDMNVIEHVWHYLKVKLYKLQPSYNAQELWDNVCDVMKEMWNDEMTERVQNLFESMPRRMQAIVKARGGHTKY